jgi:IS30 family transposase
LEREEISRGLVAGRSMRSMAVSLARAPSSVSRELRRNGGRRDYRASDADQSQIVTLVERQTRYVMMAKVRSKNTQTVIDALVKHARQLP